MTAITNAPSDQANKRKTTQGLGMGLQVLIAVLLGIAAGLFFGELITKIKFVGDIYIGLLQMMVLPYIIIALISGIGKLSLAQAKQLAKYAILALLAMWAIIVIVLVLLALALPDLTSASFFSSSLVEPAKQSNLLSIFIPENVFASLNNNQVPAVVVFCIALGIALISAENKQEVLKLFDVLADAVMRVIKFVVMLTPVGVFTMTAIAAGTMSFDDLGRLQGYFLLFTAAVIILGFYLLPSLVVCLTPFKYKDIMAIAWPAMALAFAAPKVVVVLPLIIEGIKRLFEQYQVKDANAVATAEMLVPLAYPFPQTGKLLELFFVPFAAWFIGAAIALSDYPVFLASGLLSFFGSAEAAIPFLLDLMRLPADLFQIYLLADVYSGPVSHVLRAIDLFALATLVACASSGMLRFRWYRSMLVLAGAAIVFLVLVLGTRTYLGHVAKGAYDKDKVISSMQLMEDIVPSTIVAPTANPVPLETNQSRLQRIRTRGVIRIGYDPHRLPFSYTNSAEKLVGFDIDMAQRLARELDVSIEFVPFAFDSLTQQLKDDHFDIAMSGIYGTAEQSGNIRFSDPYLFASVALVVPDHRDTDFASPQTIHKVGPVRFGIHRSLSVAEVAQTVLGDHRNIEFVPLESYRDFFESKGTGKNLDALLTGAESGSAWTLLYPDYQVVTPWGGNFTIPLVYPYSSDEDNQMDEFVDHWVLLKQHDGTIRKAYEHWILGKGGEQQTPRWSIVRDILGWID